MFQIYFVTFIQSTAQPISEEPDPYCNPAHPPSVPLPPNFSWVFLHGFWTLVPAKFSKDISAQSQMNDESSQLENHETWSEGNLAEVNPHDPTPLMSEGSGQEGDSTDSQGLEDFESDFEEKVNRLLISG